MQIVRDLQVKAMAHAVINFTSSEWTEIDLSTVGPNLTEKQPGEDVQSVLIHNKSGSSSAAHIVFKRDPGAGIPASHGFEIEVGGVLQEGTVKNIRYLSLRGATGSGTVKLILRSHRTAQEAPWGN
tara:strand:+ start:3413 stop:3790 length:378 start_codon:yes stop_codon:yes gene_type:complete